MNGASLWRLEIAERIAPLYAANPRVAAVIVGGSTARGHADRYSDIEIGVFWRQPPKEDERRQVIQQAGADLLCLYPFDPQEEVWSDDYTVGRNAADEPKSGILVEVANYTTEFTQRTFDSVLKQYNPDEIKQNLVAGVLDGLPLAGVDVVREWQSQASVYPAELAAAVVRRHALIDHFWRSEMWLSRGDNRMMLYRSFFEIEQKLLHILLGVNRIYYFGFKWLDVVAERLVIAPPDLTRRLQQVYVTEPGLGAQQLATIVEEVYNLVETHLPDVDLVWLRSAFRYQRPLWDEAPSS